jgi:hypothetical protein
LLLCLIHDRIDINSGCGCAPTAYRLRACIEANPQGVDGTKYKAHSCAGMTALNPDHPLTADANAVGEVGLAEAKFFATVSDNCSEIRGSADKHDDTMSTFADMVSLSAIDDN